MNNIEQPTTTKRSRLARLVVLGLWVWAGLVLVAAWGPWVELASHFILHGVIVGLLISVRLAWGRHWKLVALSLPPIIYFVCLLAPWSLWAGKTAAEQAVAENSFQRELSVMSWNVLCVNQQLAEIERVISEHPVDVLILIEVRPNLFEQVPAIKERYRHCLAYPAWQGNGIAVLTNRDDLRLSRIDLAGLEMPSIEIAVDQSQLKVLAMHTWSPMPPGRAGPRDKQLAALKLWAREQQLPVCVAGDLNITPWAPAFSRMLDAGFVDARAAGYGNQASWPSWLGPLGIPIDHALSFGHCQVVNRRLGPMVWGSDHRPILFDVRY